MNQYDEIATLQYMGSKARIISHIDSVQFRSQ